MRCIKFDGFYSVHFNGLLLLDGELHFPARGVEFAEAPLFTIIRFSWG